MMRFHRRFILSGMSSLAMASLLAVPVTLSVNPAGAAEKIKIGFLLKTMQEERYQRDKAAFLAKAGALGAEVIFDSANNDEQTQLAAFENMLSQGAQVIVYQSATSTFQGTWGPDQHASLGAVRAAETGRPAVQAALTGVTAAFDDRGRLLAWMGQSSHGVVTVRLGLPAASARTIYDQLGDYVPWTATGVAILAALVMFANSRGFPGRSAGINGGHEAQYVTGQSVPR